MPPSTWIAVAVGDRRHRRFDTAWTDSVGGDPGRRETHRKQLRHHRNGRFRHGVLDTPWRGDGRIGGVNVAIPDSRYQEAARQNGEAGLREAVQELHSRISGGMQSAKKVR